MIRHTLVVAGMSGLGLFLACAGSVITGYAQQNSSRSIRLAIHGGAGAIPKSEMTPEKEAAYREDLRRALVAGHEVLKRGGSSLDAVEVAIRILEDSPLFNAGKGAVFTAAGKNELDASIMDGATRKAGAVAGVTRVKNPITLARMVMERSPHVMMVSTGAEAFAKEQGAELVDEKYFYTEERWKSLQKAKEAEKAPKKSASVASSVDWKFGTVGAVALDRAGNLAAGTSTGGMTNKRFGRVGDSPVIGAGTYADNATCAVSATGHGEYFIRSVVAYDISALMAYRGMSVKEAADLVVMDKLVKIGGEGGVIAMDRDGNVAMPFNSPGMFRGTIDEDGKISIAIYKE